MMRLLATVAGLGKSNARFTPLKLLYPFSTFCEWHAETWSLNGGGGGFGRCKKALQLEDKPGQRRCPSQVLIQGHIVVKALQMQSPLLTWRVLGQFPITSHLPLVLSSSISH